MALGGYAHSLAQWQWGCFCFNRKLLTGENKMKLFPLFLALSISLLLFLSCFNHDNDPELIVEINIQGTVKDAATDKPITGAEVTLAFGGKTLQKTKTNGKGVFTFPVSQDGDYQFLVQATGYIDAEKTFPLTDLSNNDMDIKMTLANSLTITNESSYDIENVKWSNGNADFGSIKIAASVEIPVDTGSGYVFFTRVSDKLNVHTEYVSVKQGERKKYIIADTTIVVEVGYGNNKKTLGTIKTANPNPSSSSVAKSSSSEAVSSSSSTPSSSSSISSSSLAQSSSSAVVASSSSMSSSSSSISSSSVAKSSSSAMVYSSSSMSSSSSSIFSSSSIITSGTFIDDRDNMAYKWVKIGKQTWMAQNLKYYEGDNVNTKCCNCGLYGRLYTWQLAKDSCPYGWHLPSTAEWQELVDFAGGLEIAGGKLKTIDGWTAPNGGNPCNGTDDFGFSALPGGGGANCPTSSHNDGMGFWWSANNSNSYVAIGSGNIIQNYESVWMGNDYLYLFSVRCLKD
jgi:uncharacterized protein (TIGR02145 family)